MGARSVDWVMLEQRAAFLGRRKLHGQALGRGLRLAVSLLDLTTLEGNDTNQHVRSLCRRAIKPFPTPLNSPIPSVAAVCVSPTLVPIAREALAGSTVRVASVASGFPSGHQRLDVRLADVRAAIEAGSDEIDMVISRSAFLAGRYDLVATEIREMKSVCGTAPLKIILETGELETGDNVRRACDLAIDAASSVPGAGRLKDGEVFLKTSTGKTLPAATPPMSLILLESIRDHFLATGGRVGFKPAGGIRSAAAAMQYLTMVAETLGQAWLNSTLFRIGASSLVDDLVRRIVACEPERSGQVDR